MQQYKNAKVSEVMSMIADDDNIYYHGFSIISQNNKPLVSIIYNTADEANAAYKAVKKVLNNAIAVTIPGS